MKFPYADRIEPYLAAIADRDEFIVAKRDGYQIINYLVQLQDSFPDPDTAPNEQIKNLWLLRRNCRGIVFDPDGNVIAIRLNKFFNINEREETQIHNIDLSRSYDILEKLDGSMITPIIINGVVRYGTKMGLTEVAMPVEEFVKDKPWYSKWAIELHKDNLTPIYEWVSRKQRIVIDYPEDRLILLAIRHNFTSEYIKFDELKNITPQNIPIVEKFEGSINGLQDLINYTRGLKDVEGFVIRFADGQMLKIKTDEYVKIHKSKEALKFEKDVIDLLISEKVDDVKPFLTAEDLKRVTDYETAFWAGINAFTSDLASKYKEGKELAKEDKKVFAVEYVNKQEHLIRPLLYQIWAGKETREVVLDLVKRNIGSSTEVEGIRKVFNTSPWNCSITIDE